MKINCPHCFKEINLSVGDPEDNYEKPTHILKVEAIKYEVVIISDHKNAFNTEGNYIVVKVINPNVFKGLKLNTKISLLEEIK